MRISDWSSDVCSSDLLGTVDMLRHHGQAVVAVLRVVPEAEVAELVDLSQPQPFGEGQLQPRLDALMPRLAGVDGRCRNVRPDRELQQLALQVGAVEAKVPARDADEIGRAHV